MRNQYQYICNQYDTYLSLVIPLVFKVQEQKLIVHYLKTYARMDLKNFAHI